MTRTLLRAGALGCALLISTALAVPARAHQLTLAPPAAPAPPKDAGADHAAWEANRRKPPAASVVADDPGLLRCAGGKFNGNKEGLSSFDGARKCARDCSRKARAHGSTVAGSKSGKLIFKETAGQL